MTIGTFDCFHRGHAELLTRAASFGRLYVGVNSDRFVEEYKGRPAVQGEESRLRRVRGFTVADGACINDGPGNMLIMLVKPDLLVVGSDWHDHYLPQIGMTPEELFYQLRCGVCYLPRTPGVSTSELRA